MDIECAIFDMDGTLIDSLSFYKILWQEIGVVYFNDPTFKPSETVEKKIRTMVYVDAMSYVYESCNIIGDKKEFIEFATKGVFDYYKNVATVKTGAIELLEYLKNKNVKICLASATAMDKVKFALDCHGLTKYFDLVLSCADMGVGKDKPDIYHKAIKELNVNIAESCVFEDSFVAIVTAK